MSYLSIYQTAIDPDFQGRCLVACWTAARDILAEDRTVKNHRERIDWARRILRGGQNITPTQLAVQVLANATVAQKLKTAEDGDLQFVVNSVIDNLIEIG